MTKKGLEKLEDLIRRSEDIMHRADCLKRDIRRFYTIEEDVENIDSHEVLTNAVWAMEEVVFRAECSMHEMQGAYKSEKALMEFYDSLRGGGRNSED